MIVRVNKTQDYTTMSNHHLKNRNLTLKAKGLLSVILSLPEDWNYSVAGLASISREKTGAINSALRELKGAGYLVITKKMPNETKSGRIEYEWDFYEQPQFQKQDKEKQTIENQVFEIQGLENSGQLNTNNKITKDKNTKDIYIYDEQPKKTRFIRPTLEEVTAYCRERNNNVDPQAFIDHYTANGWTIGKSPMQDWKSAVRTWERLPKKRSYKTKWRTGAEAGIYHEEHSDPDPSDKIPEGIIPEDIISMFGDQTDDD